MVYKDSSCLRTAALHLHNTDVYQHRESTSAPFGVVYQQTTSAEEQKEDLASFRSFTMAACPSDKRLHVYWLQTNRSRAKPPARITRGPVIPPGTFYPLAHFPLPCTTCSWYQLCVTVSDDSALLRSFLCHAWPRKRPFYFKVFYDTLIIFVHYILVFNPRDLYFLGVLKIIII